MVFSVYWLPLMASTGRGVRERTGETMRLVQAVPALSSSAIVAHFATGTVPYRPLSTPSNRLGGGRVIAQPPKIGGKTPDLLSKACACILAAVWGREAAFAQGTFSLSQESSFSTIPERHPRFPERLAKNGEIQDTRGFPVDLMHLDGASELPGIARAATR